MKASLTTHLRYNAERFPEKPVFIYPGQHSNWEIVTYRQLSERSNRLARGLVTYGIRPGTRAALMLPPSVDMFALVFALLQTGIVPIMVDPAIGLRNVTPCLAESEPEVYFGSALTHAIRHVFGWGKASLRLNLTLTDILRAGVSTPDVQPVQLNPNDEAAIVYTSGSTGLPKGAIYTLANFDAQIELLANTLQLNGSEVDLPAFPLFAIIDCLLGVTAVIPDMRFPAPAKVNPIRMLTAIHTHQVDTMFVSPVALASLSLYCTENNLKLPSLRKVITAGAPAPAKIQEQFTKLLSTGSELFGIYGSTEALPVSIVNSREILHETRHLSAQGAGVCIGRPVTGLPKNGQAVHIQIIQISDEVINPADLQTLPVGEIGEIAVKGSSVTQKYIGRDQVNRLAKIILENGETIHRMGDVGYFDEKGRLWYCGRKSQRVQITGGTLFTEAVEGIFNAHPLVYRTALVGVKNAGSLETAQQACLWVELLPSARGADQNLVRAELLEMAKNYEMTRAIKNILFHPSFPTDVRHNSKIIREKLAKQAQGRI